MDQTRVNAKAKMLLGVHKKHQKSFAAVVVGPDGMQCGSLDPASRRGEVKYTDGAQPETVKVHLAHYLADSNATNTLSDDAHTISFTLAAGDNSPTVTLPGHAIKLSDLHLVEPQSEEWMNEVNAAPTLVKESLLWRRHAGGTTTSGDAGTKGDQTTRQAAPKIAIFKIVVEKPHLASSSRVMCPTTDDGKGAHSLDVFRSMLDTSDGHTRFCYTVWLAIGRAEEFRATWDVLVTAMKHQVTFLDPFRAAYKVKCPKMPHNPQLGPNALDSDRPVPTLIASRPLEYIDACQAMTSTMFALKESDRYEEARVTAINKLRPRLKLFTVPSGGDQFYLGFMEIKSTDADSSLSRLAENEELMISFSPDEASPGVLFPATVIFMPQLAGRPSIMPLLVTRPTKTDKVLGEDSMEEASATKLMKSAVEQEIRSFSSGSVASHAELKRMIDQAPAVPIAVTKSSNKKTSETLIRGSSQLLGGGNPRMDSLREHVLLKDTRPVKGGHEFMGDEAVKLYKECVMSEQQQRVAENLHSMPKDRHGIAVTVVVGVPGSGKTHTLCAALMAQQLRPNSQDTQLLLVASSNHPCDVLVDRLLELEKAMNKKEERKALGIARCHGARLEMAFAKAFIQKTFGPKRLEIGGDLRSAKRTEDGDLDLDGVGFNEYELSMLSGFREHLRHGPRLLRDRRFNQFNNLCAMWALKLRSLYDDEWVDEEGEIHEEIVHPDVRDDLEDYRETGGERSLNKVLRSVQKALEEVYESADILVGTVVAVSQPDIARVAKGRTLVIDEAGRTTMAEHYCLLGHFAPSTIIMCGDTEQLQPVVPASPQCSVFCRDMRISVLSAYADLRRWPTVFMNEQHRAHPGLMSLANVVGRRSMKDAAELTQREQSQWPNTHRLRKTMKRLGIFTRHKHDVPIYVIETMGSTQLKNSAVSSFNPTHTKIALNVVEELLADGVQAKHITILTPYDASRGLFKRSLVHATQNSSLDSGTSCHIVETDVRTADEIQGGENSIIVFVPCVVNSVGFVAEVSRLFVSLSRAEEGLVCVVESSIISSQHNANAKKFSEVFAVASTEGWTASITMADRLCSHKAVDMALGEHDVADMLEGMGLNTDHDVSGNARDVWRQDGGEINAGAMVTGGNQAVSENGGAAAVGESFLPARQSSHGQVGDGSVAGGIQGPRAHDNKRDEWDDEDAPAKADSKMSGWDDEDASAKADSQMSEWEDGEGSVKATNEVGEQGEVGALVSMDGGSTQSISQAMDLDEPGLGRPAKRKRLGNTRGASPRDGGRSHHAPSSRQARLTGADCFGSGAGQSDGSSCKENLPATHTHASDGHAATRRMNDISANADSGGEYIGTSEVAAPDEEMGDGDEEEL